MSVIHVVLAPCAFKGTLSAADAAEAMRRGTLSALPDADCRIVPMADGGDGSIDVFVSAGYDRREAAVRDSSGAWHSASIAVSGDRAVVEVASTCGITLPGAQPLRPWDASSAGVGDAILAALDAGARDLTVCLGGSASTDGGAGLLVALGVRILDASGNPVPPHPRHLDRAARLDLTGLDPRLGSCRITVLADVTSPLHGPEGAAFVFAPQKGATTQEVAGLDEALAAWGPVLSAACGRDITNVPGAGAAGGLGAALLALGAAIEPGSATLAVLTGVPRAVAIADLVITGEGAADDQTLHGKGMAEVIDMARAAGVPVLAVCGQMNLASESLDTLGLSGWRACTQGSQPPATSDDARALLEQATVDAVREWWEKRDPI